MNESSQNRAPRLRLRLTSAAETAIRSGHPWVFAESIQSQNRPGQLGELAVVYDRKNRFLAVGLFDPQSQIRVRVLHTGKPQTLDHQWWSARLRQGLAPRQALFDDQTTGYRCINGESDGWPGLVLDRYDRTLVLKLYSAAWLPCLDQTTRLIAEHLQPERIVLRLSRNVSSRAEVNGQILFGSPAPAAVHFLETGLRFEADVLRGQKTGFFLDQRENRRHVERLARGRAVLNAFSFSGGFSLYAARGGARSITDLDSSAHALAGARRNFALNSSNSIVSSCRHELIQAEAFAWLGQSLERKFDLIVLDPPSLAKREAERPGALRAYAKLAALGISHLAPGGILVACSCSAHVTAEEFFGVVRHAAASSGRRFREMFTTAHPLDHPATFKEAQYLKAIYLQVD